jgi:uncharacterized Zn finger protein
MPRIEMAYCPFCGTAEIALAKSATEHVGPETYYSCPNCGTVGHLGIWSAGAEHSSARPGDDGPSGSRA